jgi:ornithine cyclodeaminase
MMRIFTRSEIEKAVVPQEVIAALERGFVAYSRGEVATPPVGYLRFDDPPGDLHIKYGHRRGDDTFVIKIASGFYDNPRLGLGTGNGMMIVLSARTGAPIATLLDEACLTDLRTAAAGAVAAKYLAPRAIEAIGIIGGGVQARLQLDLLRHVTPCRRALIWARNPDQAKAYRVEGFEVEPVRSVADLARRCNLIVTTTAARAALLQAADVRPGTHITAVGADAPGKQELEAELFRKAQVRVVDSRSQCFDHGDAVHALQAGVVQEKDFVELGEVIANPALGRTREEQISLVDLTGLAIQDIEIAKLACQALMKGAQT